MASNAAFMQRRRQQRHRAESLEAYRATPRLLREATAAEMPQELRDALRAFLEEKKRRS